MRKYAFTGFSPVNMYVYLTPDFKQKVRAISIDEIDNKISGSIMFYEKFKYGGGKFDLEIEHYDENIRSYMCVFGISLLNINYKNVPTFCEIKYTADKITNWIKEPVK